MGKVEIANLCVVATTQFELDCATVVIEQHNVVRGVQVGFGPHAVGKLLVHTRK